MQGLIVQDGIVLKCAMPGNLPMLRQYNPGCDCFDWDGAPVQPGDADPRPVEDRYPNYSITNKALPLMGETDDPVVFAIQKWLELYGDWLNDLNFAVKGSYRLRTELLGEWIERMKGTYTPPQS